MPDEARLIPTKCSPPFSVMLPTKGFDMKLRFRTLALMVLMGVSAAGFAVMTAQEDPTPSADGYQLLVTQSLGKSIALVDPNAGVVKTMVVGSAPWGIALSSDNRAFISTDAGVAVVDVAAWELVAVVPYQTAVSSGRFGEYRQGGMGITIAQDDSKVYVGVYTGGQTDQLEVLDTVTFEFTASVPIGIRPFDVVMSADGQHVISIDHDSYSATVIDTSDLRPTTVLLTPLGNGSYDKPHYAAVANDGHLWLPYQGRILVDLDPLSGEYTTTPLTANTHQHGVAFTPDQSKLIIVGTGAAGEVSNAPSLTLIEMATLQETIIPLIEAHEKIIISPDGRYAYLSGGYLLNGGWNGLTVVDLQTFALRKIVVPDAPLDMVIIADEASASE